MSNDERAAVFALILASISAAGFGIQFGLGVAIAAWPILLVTLVRIAAK